MKRRASPAAAAPDPGAGAPRTAPDAGPATVEELAAACLRANSAQAQSLARRFVALDPGQEQGWLVLLACTERCGDARETARLAALGRERFPASEALRLAHARALGQEGRLEEAASLLRDRELSLADALLLAHVELALDPERAGRVYAAVASHSPGDPVAAMGLRAAASACKPGAVPPAVGFLLEADWHGWIQQPVAEALEAAGIPFACASHPWMLAAQRPRIVVLSSPTPSTVQELRLRLPGTRIVNTRHGVSVNGKNYGLYGAAACDYVCASSEWLAAELCRLALLPAARVWATGYPQMDGLFRRRRERPTGEPARPGRSVLFAPTFNPEMSAAYLVGEDPVPALRGDDESIRVVLTGHPQLRKEAPRLLDAWRAQARARPNVEFMEPGGCNVVTRLADADVLVSDVSSVAAQYLALDRPLVRLVDLSRARASSAYAPDGTEWRLEPVAITVTHRGDLATAVRRALAGPEPEVVAALRGRLREELFGSLTDGRAGERIAQRIVQALGETASPSPAAEPG